MKGVISMCKKINYAIILFGGMKIEGFTKDWSVSETTTATIVFEDGNTYKTSVANVLLMYKERES